MWMLYRTEQGRDTSERTLLRPGKTYTLGRKGTDIVLEGDKSISRKHATIAVEIMTAEDLVRINQRPSVSIRDESSKYGTFVNEKRVAETDYINDCDVIKIGSLNCVLRIRWEPVVLCRQSLKGADKLALYQNALKLGIKVTDTWQLACTHLYMVEIRLSYKTFCCLAAALPIVSPVWLESLVETPDTNFILPQQSALPQIHSSCRGPKGIPNFRPNHLRQSLFDGTCFVVYQQDQLERLQNMIELAKGTVRLSTCREEMNTKRRSSVLEQVHIVPQQSSPDWASFTAFLQRHQKRPIAEEDIGWAITYCSKAVLGLEKTTSNATGQDPSMASSSASSAHNSDTTRLSLSMISTFDDLIGNDAPQPPPIATSSHSHITTPATMATVEARSHDNHRPMSEQMAVSHNPSPATAASTLPPFPDIHPSSTTSSTTTRPQKTRSRIRTFISHTPSSTDPPPQENDHDEPLDPGKKYTVVAMTSLVVAPNPSDQISRHLPTGTNVKPFQKTSQFSDVNLMNFVHMADESAVMIRPRPGTRRPAPAPSQAAPDDDNSDIDPDIRIRVTKRRR